MTKQLFEQKNITVPVASPQLLQVMKFIGECLDELDCPGKAQIHIRIAVDEIISNIVRHADPDKNDTITVTVRTEEAPRSVVITFTDNSKQFNPLTVKEPNVTISARERKIGGLGIFMLKKIMDEISYEYKDKQNTLTVRKNI